MKHRLFILALASYLIVPITAGEIRHWKLKNGESLEGRVLTSSENDAVILLANKDNVMGSLPLEKFAVSEHDQILKDLPDKDKGVDLKKWIKVIHPEPEFYPPMPPVGWQLVGWDKGKRADIPSYNQTDYGFKAGSCLPNSLVNFVDWWDKNKTLQIPRQRTEAKQIDWLHRVLSRAANTRNRGTSWYDLAKGVNEMSGEKFSGNYCFPCYYIRNITPEKLARYTQGNAAVCMSLSVYYGRRYSSGHGVSVAHASPNGDITVLTWGQKVKGKLQPIDTIYKGEAQDHGQAYEMIISNTDELPDYFTRNEVRFVIEPARADRTYVFLPYERLRVGNKWQPHPRSHQKVEPVKIPVSNVKAVRPDIDFIQKTKPLSRTWVSLEGKTLQASLTQVEADVGLFKTPGRKFKIPVKQFLDEDQMKIRFWQASSGHNYTLPTSTLVYTLENNDKRVPMTIGYDGKSRAVLKVSGEREYRYDAEQRTLAIYCLKSNRLLSVARIQKTHARSLRSSQTDWQHHFRACQYGEVAGYAGRISNYQQMSMNRSYVQSKFVHAYVYAPGIADLLSYALSGSYNAKVDGKDDANHRPGTFRLLRSTSHATGDAMRHMRGVSRERLSLPLYLTWADLRGDKESIRISSVSAGAEVDFSMPPEVQTLEIGQMLVLDNGPE